MNATTRAILTIFIILLMFGLSWLSYDHIDNSYLMGEDSDYVEEIEDRVDSLRQVSGELKAENKELLEKLSYLEGKEDEE